LNTVSPRDQPILSAITVAGILGYAPSSSRIRGSTSSTIDPAGCRTYRGGRSEASAALTVLREQPITPAIVLIGILSARRSRRISAQSSTDNTPSSSPGSVRARVSAQGVKIRAPRRGQFSGVVDRSQPAGPFHYSLVLAIGPAYEVADIARALLRHLYDCTSCSGGRAVSLGSCVALFSRRETVR
jgi:hypothetical protein